MEKVVLSAVGITLSVLVGLLGVKVILSISTLYELTFISNLGFLKIYGVVSLINLLLSKYKDRIIEEGDEMYKEMFARILHKVVTILLVWGASYLMYFTLK